MLCEKNTLQSKNPFVDSDLSFLKALPILHGTWQQGSLKSTKSLQNPSLLESLKSNFHLKVDRSIGESECSRPCFKNCLRRHFSLFMPQTVLLSTLLDFRFYGFFPGFRIVPSGQAPIKQLKDGLSFDGFTLLSELGNCSL